MNNDPAHFKTIEEQIKDYLVNHLTISLDVDNDYSFNLDNKYLRVKLLLDNESFYQDKVIIN